jgi:CRP-like cAMP-binding protein
MQAALVNGDDFQLPLTQEQMGDHLGLTVVPVNRTLKKLREEGVLSTASGLARIHDVEALATYAAPIAGHF